MKRFKRFSLVLALWLVACGPDAEDPDTSTEVMTDVVDDALAPRDDMEDTSIVTDIALPECPEGELCDDGDPCTQGDGCQSGACLGEPYSCDDGDVCTTEVCDGEGGCTSAPRDCDDGEVCTRDLCVPVLGCVHEVWSPPCDDGDACTRDDHCEDGICVGTQVADCTQPTCGDGLCQPEESCSSCPSDCSPAGLGLCEGACDPTSATGCPENFACVPTVDGALNVTPFAAANGRCGVACDAQGSCEEGVCVTVEGLASPGLCLTGCDPSGATGCAEGMSCVALEVAGVAGVCSPWALCDPAAEGPCGEAPGGSCLPVSEAPGAGLCRSICWAAWPETCPSAFGECVALAEPSLHQGECVGQAVACDIATQAGCGAGETCRPLVDPALAGVARVSTALNATAWEAEPSELSP